MRKWSRYVAGVVAVTGLLALVTYAGAETCKLEIKRIDRTARVASGRVPVEYWFQSTRPQSFFMQIGGPPGMIGVAREAGTPEFSKVITKEPSTYNSQHPFRGVAKLGSQYFGFVLDAATKQDAKEKDKAESDSNAGAAAKALRQLVGARKVMEPVAYERLYFDLNHNGDLTDDQVIQANSAGDMPSNYASSVFPGTDLAIEVDDVKIEYAFSMNVYSYGTSDYSYANASLSAAAYREGEMTIDGKKRHVVIVNFNSNGRFDDPSKIDDSVQLSDGTVYPTMGDMLYIIDPEAQPDGYANPYDPSTNSNLHYVGKLINLDSRFMEVTVSPSGDEVTLEPSPIPVGYVTNPNEGYRAIVYGEQGFLTITGDESGKASLPQGEWKLASYTIDKTASSEPAQEEAKKESWLDALKRAVTGTAGVRMTQPRYTMVSARAKRDSQAVRVKEGETVEMPFGGPYRPIVTVGYTQGDGKVSLSMSLVGSANEICTNLMVNGGRPGKPKFTITTEKGEEVDTGNFEYG